MNNLILKNGTKTIAHSFLFCAKMKDFVYFHTQKLLISLEIDTFFCHKLPI